MSNLTNNNNQTSLEILTKSRMDITKPPYNPPCAYLNNNPISDFYFIQFKKFFFSPKYDSLGPTDYSLKTIQYIGFDGIKTWELLYDTLIIRDIPSFYYIINLKNKLPLCTYVFMCMYVYVC